MENHEDKPLMISNPQTNNNYDRDTVSKRRQMSIIPIYIIDLTRYTYITIRKVTLSPHAQKRHRPYIHSESNFSGSRLSPQINDPRHQSTREKEKKKNCQLVAPRIYNCQKRLRSAFPFSPLYIYIHYTFSTCFCRAPRELASHLQRLPGDSFAISFNGTFLGCIDRPVCM